MKNKPANRLVVGDASWADMIPEWLLEEIAAERLIGGLAGLMSGKAETVGDAEVCAYLMTASLRAPMPGDFTEIYMWICGRVFQRLGRPVLDFMEAKLKQGLTYSEQHELAELRATIYRSRGWPAVHPLLDAMKQLKKDTADMPPIAGAADPEYNPRIDAARATAEFRQPSRRRVDSGKTPVEEAPLFGGAKQGDLF